ncbi:hypothetical protein O2K51_11920 [Apibacter raozihei]|uniref:helix-turn-helix transcriptional regulator n=1 Tax=Apibacter TaxID=1778601 RepID=UPI000FE2E42A|nr:MULTISPECIES: hypothetical protein [Apibacter]
MNLQKIWDNISDIGIEHEEDEKIVYRVRLLNQYIFIVFLVFFIHALHNFLYIKDMYSGNVLMYLSMFFLIALFIPVKLKSFRFLVFSVFLLLIWVIFFYESYSNNESGIYFYYFPLILALPFIFDFKTDYIYMIIIVLLVLMSILINIVTEYSWFINDELTHSIKRNTTFISASISGMIVIVDLVFIIKKNYIIHKLYEETFQKELQLEEQKKQLLLLSEKGVINSKQKLIQLAINNDSSFFSTFSEVYPSFFSGLLKLDPDLSVAELEFCAYTKLGFSIKEIATYKYISIRAVEARKYRIRKKLNFATGKELNAWILDFDIDSRI